MSPEETILHTIVKELDIKFYISKCKYHQSVLPKGRSFTTSSGTKTAVLLKGRSSTANSGNKIAVLIEMNRCGSFTLLSANHSLLSIWKIWKDPRGTNEEVRRVDLANWALRTSSKYATGVKYQFHQDFWPDQRFWNPNHPSPPYIYIISVLPKGRSYTGNVGTKDAVLPGIE